MINGDVVADMITRIRNANLRKSTKVDVIHTKLTSNIANILKQEGFIESFEESGDILLQEKGMSRKYISIFLKYKGIKQKPYITGIKKVSNPGLRVYVNQTKIPRVLGGIGVAVLSTSKGLLTDRVARVERVGGEVLFTIW
uniref:Small ribosomal subunit protein uS8c n=1 Tax=Monomorphina parapyrum TaxID=1664066 RepID=A0A0G3VJX1_9EUGL|nr:ribosomal protein S8 [Monomorphina parapyrum]AKL78945.1 ribosomal protein S8 [Monomorphina parapyrum]